MDGAKGGPEDFCTWLNKKTKGIHDEADKAVRLKLAVALTDVTIYASVLADFYHIFKAAEDLIKKHQKSEYVSGLWVPALERTKAFRQDLEFYLGLGWRDIAKPSNAALEYISHIEYAYAKDPVLLVAFIQTMYLAILAGGYILKSIIKRTLGLREDSGGLATFSFQEESRVKLKSHIKSTINGMELSDELKQLILREKIRIFHMNNLVVANVHLKLSSYKRLAKLVTLLVIFFVFLFYVMYQVAFS